MQGFKLALLVSLLIALCPTFIQAQADPCTCNGTNQATQYRTTTKQRKIYSRYPKSKLIITPAEIVSWQAKYDSKTA